jgi:hypothetical protein
MEINYAKVQLNPRGSRDHEHTIRGKINNTSMFAMEKLLGDRHSTGDDNKMSAEWFLVTDHGSVTVNDWWAYNEGEFAINAANNRAANVAVLYFKQHGMQAYVLQGEI